MKKITVTIYVLPWQLDKWNETFNTCEKVESVNDLDSWILAPFEYQPNGTIKSQLDIPLDTFNKFKSLRKEYKIKNPTAK
ncbi:MAG: hypothetical protein SLAVMIC_00441 [uncultured marine phage]|uniref:Uncharacterized protein n=1 Tax=uncultured marine phage TaxID=707152 RepID=A0A8D9C8X6_9VIRU|nr:MAG: hypothetical protein SLAVMIC_00441 [uncultured marine phage]